MGQDEPQWSWYREDGFFPQDNPPSDEKRHWWSGIVDWFTRLHWGDVDWGDVDWDGE